MPATKSKTKAKGGAPKGNKNAVGNKGGGRVDGFKPEYCLVATAMCKLGALDHQIADELGISVRTFYAWKAKQVEFAAAIRRGKDVADDIVEDSLFRNATGFEYEVEKVFVQNGEVIRVPVREVKHPDTSAQSLWLRSRRPDVYREVKAINKQITLHEGLRAALEEMSEQSKLRRAERAKLANPAKLIEQERIKVD